MFRRRVVAHTLNKTKGEKEEGEKYEYDYCSGEDKAIIKMTRKFDLYIRHVEMKHTQHYQQYLSIHLRHQEQEMTKPFLCAMQPSNQTLYPKHEET